MSSPEPVTAPAPKRLLTKRFALAGAGLLLASALCWLGKIGGDAWVFAFATALAGHRAEDIVKAYRRQP
jgi:hypothetical protein